eukprot:2899221-Rhodomonas_salina.1
MLLLCECAPCCSGPCCCVRVRVRAPTNRAGVFALSKEGRAGGGGEQNPMDLGTVKTKLENE